MIFVIVEYSLSTSICMLILRGVTVVRFSRIVDNLLRLENWTLHHNGYQLWSWKQPPSVAGRLIWQ